MRNIVIVGSLIAILAFVLTAGFVSSIESMEAQEVKKQSAHNNVQQSLNKLAGTYDFLKNYGSYEILRLVDKTKLSVKARYEIQKALDEYDVYKTDYYAEYRRDEKTVENYEFNEVRYEFNGIIINYNNGELTVKPEQKP